MSILKLFVDTLRFFEKGGNYNLCLNREYSGFRFINDTYYKMRYSFLRKKKKKGGGGFNASAKTIDSGQPAQSALADLSRNFLQFVNFLQIKELCHNMIHLVVKAEGMLGKVEACLAFKSNRYNIL